MVRVSTGRLAQVGGLLFAVLIPCQPLGAQAAVGNQFVGGFGYVASPPDALLGAQVLGFHRSGWGAFADAITSRRAPARDPHYASDVSAAEAEKVHGDLRFHGVEHWRAVNAGVVRALTPALALYAGGGLARQEAFAEFHDQSRERGNDFGYYWVRDHEASGTHVSVAAGALFLLTPRVAAHFGGGTAPPAARIGVTYLIGARTTFPSHTNRTVCVEPWTESAC